MHTILIVIHVFLAVGLIGLILMQHGKGADAGAAFGSGASATVFGAQGSANFLSRATAVFAAAFFLTSLAMGWYSMQASSKDRGSLMQGMDQRPVGVTEMPAVEAPPVESEVPQVDVAPEASVPEVPAPDAEPGDSGGAETVVSDEVPAAVPAGSEMSEVPAMDEPQVEVDAEPASEPASGDDEGVKEGAEPQ